MKLVVAFGLLLVAVISASYQGHENAVSQDKRHTLDLLRSLEEYLAKRGELDDAEDDLTDPEDQELSDALESLDERTLDDLMAVIDVTGLDNEPEERSLLQQKEEDILYTSLLLEHPQLRELAEAEETDALDVQARKFGSRLKKWVKKLWQKWLPKVRVWLRKLGKYLACKICQGLNKVPPGMKRLIWRLLRKLIKGLACLICRSLG